MPQDTGPLVLTVVVALAISLGIADAAAGGAPNAWLWGFLGPIGWVIAAIVGLRARVDALREAIALTTSRDPAKVCRSCHAEIPAGRDLCAHCTTPTS